MYGFLCKRWFQGDQMGRIFVFWAIIDILWAVLNYKSSLNILGTFFDVLLLIFFLQKMAWATLWAILSKTHLVTLDGWLVLTQPVRKAGALIP
jgi:hypothetical protein